jgi:hypothetical protein
MYLRLDRHGHIAQCFIKVWRRVLRRLGDYDRARCENRAERVCHHTLVHATVERVRTVHGEFVRTVFRRQKLEAAFASVRMRIGNMWAFLKHYAP